MNETELTKLWETHKSAAMGLAVKILESQEDAEDVVQEVFLALLHQPTAPATAPDDPKAYLLAAVRGRAIDVIRSRERQNDLINDLIELSDENEDCEADSSGDRLGWAHEQCRDMGCEDPDYGSDRA